MKRIKNTKKVERMKFGNKELTHGLFLGPMAGVTDKVYRLLCQEQGCEVTYTEMVSAKAIYYKNQKTHVLLDIDEKEENTGVQLFGREPELMAEMIKKIDALSIASFDVNMGCPVPKIVNNGEGSALMKEPILVGKIVKALSMATTKPVSIKIRSGFDEDHINAVEISKIAEANGAASIAVHGRSREQYYSGKANWDIIKAVKEAVSIPVIGNGDVVDSQTAFQMFDYTGCDGIMIGRAAKGNPWIFKEIVAAMDDKEYCPPTGEEIVEMIRRHGAMLLDHKGEYIAMREMRKHVSWYTYGLKHAAKLRGEINQVETFQDLNRLIEKILDK